MLAGVGGIDLVMLVVAADESVMPQTREHFEICRLLHIPKGIIVLTKADLVDGDLRELAALETRELVAGSFLEEAPLVEVSSKTGEGIESLKTALTELARDVPGRSDGGLFRLPVDRVFSMKGFRHGRHRDSHRGCDPSGERSRDSPVGPKRSRARSTSPR